MRIFVNNSDMLSIADLDQEIFLETKEGHILGLYVIGDVVQCRIKPRGECSTGLELNLRTREIWDKRVREVDD